MAKFTMPNEADIEFGPFQFYNQPPDPEKVPADREWLEQRGWKARSDYSLKCPHHSAVFAVFIGQLRSIGIHGATISYDPTRGWVERFEALLEEGKDQL